jgi:hypothetical protein
MSAVLLLDASRVVVAVSTVAALAAHAWLTIGHAWIPYLSVAAFVVGAVGGWTWRRGTQALILATGHVWPLISYYMLGSIEPLAMMVWVSAVAALALATAPLGRWSLPRTWQIPVAAWGMLLAVGWPLVLARELDFTLITYFENGTLNGVWAGGPRDTAAFLTGATATALVSIVVIDWLCARYGARNDERFMKDVAVPLTIGTVVALLAGVSQATIDLRWWSAGVWPVLGRAAGTFFDANAFGAVAALWATPMAGAAMMAERRGLRALGLVMLLVTAVAVWGSGSRTALLGFMVACTGIALALSRAGQLSRRVVALASAALAIIVIAGWFAGGPGSALWRVWQTMPSPSIEGVSRFAAAMWARDGYGLAAVAMVRDHPWTGVGPGAFQLFAPDYWYMLSGLMIPPDNAQNWWRHQWTELGIVAGLVPAACSLLVLGSLIGAVRRRQRPIACVAAGAIAAAAFMSILGSPVAHPIVLLTVAISIFWLSRAAEDASPTALAGHPFRGVTATATAQAPLKRCPKYVTTYATVLVVWILPLVWGGATAWTAVTELRPPQRAEAVGWPYAYGFSAPTELGNGRAQRWAAHRAVGVVPALGPSLVLELRRGQFADSTPLRVRVSTRDHLVIDQMLGPDDIARATLPFAQGQRWMMVQIEASRAGRLVDGVEHAVDVTHAFR